MGSIKEAERSDYIKFTADHNVGKLARWLRMMGYDTIFFQGTDDSQMVVGALSEDRIVLTRYTQIIKRRVATSGRLKVILLQSDLPELQIRQVLSTLPIDAPPQPFSRCLECNQLLEEKSKNQVENRVPPYVFKTQRQYMECPACHRLYWRGTHWEAMIRKLNRLAGKQL
ncbi:MAG: Mut7-C RNAse domain-containing protein [Dehalococcoidales bacterium]